MITEEEYRERFKRAFVKVLGAYEPNKPMTREQTVRVYQEALQCSRQRAEWHVNWFLEAHPGMKFKPEVH